MLSSTTVPGYSSHLSLLQHCHTISNQLNMAHSAQAQTLIELESQTQETRRLRQQVASSQGIVSQLDSQQRSLVEERNSILEGVVSLQRDLKKVQKDAIDISADLQLVRCSDAVKQPFAASICTR